MRTTRDATNGLSDVARGGAPVAALRGAAVQVDARRTGSVLGLVALVALAALVVGLFVAGMHKNSQLQALQAHPVPVVVTVTTCRGELGGSGSNPAGYACEGTYLVAGHRYDVALPGSALLTPGTTVHEVVAQSDPGLLTSPAALASQSPSWRVYVLPTALLAVLVGLALVVARRRARSAQRRVLEPFGV